MEREKGEKGTGSDWQQVENARLGELFFIQANAQHSLHSLGSGCRQAACNVEAGLGRIVLGILSAQ